MKDEDDSIPHHQMDVTDWGTRGAKRLVVLPSFFVTLAYKCLWGFVTLSASCLLVELVYDLVLQVPVDFFWIFIFFYFFYLVMQVLCSPFVILTRRCWILCDPVLQVPV